jgi:multidrug efflux system outer membrane protein
MKSIRNIILGGLAVLSLTGCKSLYGKYERPEVNTRGLFRDSVSLTDTLAARDTVSFGNMPWREVFTDSQLQVHIQKALDNNPNLLNAAININMAEAQLKPPNWLSSRSSHSPHREQFPVSTTTPRNPYQLPSLPAGTCRSSGGLTAAKREAQVSLIQMKDYQVSVQTTLVSSVANLYYTRADARPTDRTGERNGNTDQEDVGTDGSHERRTDGLPLHSCAGGRVELLLRSHAEGRLETSGA